MTTTQGLHIVLAEPEGYAPEARRLLNMLGTVVEGPFSRSELLAAVSLADVLVVRLGHGIDAALLERAPRLRVVVSATTGLDHIDLESAQRRDIAVLSLKGETEFLRTIRATVEHTFALALAVLRKIPAASAHVEGGGWDRDAFRGQELSRRRLGIVGYGRIGRAVAELAKAFEMSVIAFDPYVEPWGGWPERADTLAALLERAEVLSLHVPLNDETRGMIGASEFDALGPGAVLINTSRGGVVDEAALVSALESGRLAGAGLDVLVNEPALMRHEPRPVVEYAGDHDTVVITPHIGGGTYESMERTEVFMAEKLTAWLSAQ